MKRLYEKNELTFAIVWIILYCVLQSVANPLNTMIGIQYSVSALFCLLQAIVIFAFIRKHHLQTRFGLCKPALSAKRFLWYIPLLLLATRNFWNGFAVNLPPVDTVCYLVCMLCVGFVEEVIFRGFLFRAMEKENATSAIVVSSMTFGMGHILNLVNGSGAALSENLFQIVGAIAVGFLFVILVFRGGSLWPAIMTHAFINMSSVFANENGLTLQKRLVFLWIMLAITIPYTYILTKTLPQKSENRLGTDEML